MERREESQHVWDPRPSLQALEAFGGGMGGTCPTDPPECVLASLGWVSRVLASGPQLLRSGLTRAQWKGGSGEGEGEWRDCPLFHFQCVCESQEGLVVRQESWVGQRKHRGKRGVWREEWCLWVAHPHASSS